MGIEDKDIKDHKVFKKVVFEINPQNPIGEFDNWFKYLYYVKTQCVDIIRSITIYQDYLSKEYFQELIILEKQFLKPYIFSGSKPSFAVGLLYLETELNEILIHNQHLQLLNANEFKKYEKELMQDGEDYRNKYYNKSH